jgi:regulator of sigma E protease
MDGWSFGPSSIAAFIVFIGILIFVHELGHFVAAKYFNIKVLKFSLGFGPPLIAFKRGETQYQIAAVPLGGYVKMVGDSPVDDIAPEDRPRAFTTAPIYRRVIIALAGPVFNLVFPVMCYFAYNVLGPEVTAPVVGEIEVGLPAEKGGLKNGDRVLSVNGHRTWSFEVMADLISNRPGQDVTLEVLRDGKPVELHVVPKPFPEEDALGAPRVRGLIGVRPTQQGTRVGVDDPQRNAAGFETGDLVLSIAGQPVTKLIELERAVRANAGKTVEIVVLRSEAKAAGDLLFADDNHSLTLSAAVPEQAARTEGDASPLAALGIAPSDTFIRGLVPGGAADRAGFRPGDRIVEVDGKPISLFWMFVKEMERAQKEPVSVVVRRDGHAMKLSLASDEIIRKHEVTGKERPYYDLGIGMGSLPRDPATWHWDSSVGKQLEKAQLTLGEAITDAVQRTGEVILLTARVLFKLFSREISVDTVGGPIMIFQVAAAAASIGLSAYLQMLAMISVNLGLLNLLPIPIFDGGHLLFCAVEAVKRKPLSLRARETASIIGLVLLIALIILALRNDISRLGVF